MRKVRTAVVATAVVLGPICVVGHAAANPVLWTKITSQNGPDGSFYQFFDQEVPASASINVAGTTSAGVSAVNIYCFNDNDTDVSNPGKLNATPITVTNGAFSASGLVGPRTPFGFSTNGACVLRAVPSTYTGLSGTTNNGYVDGFAGPTFYAGEHHIQFSSGTNTNFWVDAADQPMSRQLFGSPDYDSIDQSPSDPSSHITTSPATYKNAKLGVANIPSGGGPPTSSSVVIDGHNVYFPFSLDAYATSLASDPVTVVTSSRSSDGSLSVTAIDPLSWCTGNTYPPTNGTCAVQPTGVELQRTVVSSAQGAVATVRDRFVSTDHAQHSLQVDYTNEEGVFSDGTPGVELPGQTSFAAPTVGATISSLPQGAHTIDLASDINGDDGDSQRTDAGVTYSSRPTLTFGNNTDFGLQYNRTVPKTGYTGFGFAIESGFTVGTVNGLAASAQHALSAQLAITSPLQKVTLHKHKKTTVKGKITNAVNGLPATVKIASGSKHATATVSASGSWSTKLKLAHGKRKVTATATDPGGVALSSTVHLTVKTKKKK
jgi:hypothetical protein